MEYSDRLWMDNFGFVYSADGHRLLKGASVEGAYWIPEVDRNNMTIGNAKGVLVPYAVNWFM